MLENARGLALVTKVEGQCTKITATYIFLWTYIAKNAFFVLSNFQLLRYTDRTKIW